MLAFGFMIIASVLGVYLLLQVQGAETGMIAEVLLAKAWSNRFAAQELEEKKEAYLKKYEKYRMDPEKKAIKKIKEWDKQIATYKEQEEQYLSGRKLAFLDAIPVAGYQVMKQFQLDANSDTIRELSKKCEHTGYVELEKNQETANTANSIIYAKYLLSGLISFGVVGVVLACALGAVAVAMQLGNARVIMMVFVGLVVPALLGYLPYDNLVSFAKKRQEEIDMEFPNMLSKVALLITAGMNLTNAVTMVSESGDSRMYRELQLVIKEMNRAATVTAAFTRMQCRCDNKFLDKFVSVVIKSYESSNSNLAEDLRDINSECWLNKKHEARRMGEVIQNKLFIPTMLMFVGILVVIIIPALAGFNFM